MFGVRKAYTLSMIRSLCICAHFKWHPPNVVAWWRRVGGAGANNVIYSACGSGH